MVAYNSENQVVYLNVNIQFPIFKNVALRSQVFIWSNLVNVNEGEKKERNLQWLEVYS